MQELSGGASFETLVEEAAAIPAGSDGLLLLPYFAGERTPIFDPRARGVVAGLTLRHGRAHLFRAVYEGIAFGVRQIVDFLEHEDDPIQRIVAVGGGTQGGLWTQIVSDVTGRSQQRPRADDRGVLRRRSARRDRRSGSSPETDWADEGSVVDPREDVREVYDGLYAAYGSLYPPRRRR